MGDALGARVGHDAPGFTYKNRIHLDVVCGDVPSLIAKGATLLREADSEGGRTVLADPEDNEFCAVASSMVGRPLVSSWPRE
ncbi:VOC family protein [Solicola gregarius]|uniref:VOC family protein n=1 Tax=Solicola gregarius TaxID=2908642 RepID=UPI0038CD9741